MRYITDCCQADAKKEPCARTKANKKENVFSHSSLGKWYCTKCNHKAKVKPVRE